MDLLGGVFVLLVACLTVASVCLGLVICALIAMRKPNAGKQGDTAKVKSVAGHKSETEEITGLLQEIKESSNRSSLAASGIALVGLVLGLTGIAVALKNIQLLNVALWLIGFATIYNLGILVRFARKPALRWIDRRRKAKQ